VPTSVRLIVAIAACLTAAGALAQEIFPSRQITIVAGTPAGGFADTVARVIGPVVAERIGHPVIVENRPGAGGAVGVSMVARAKPDGHTVVIGLNSALSLLPFMQKVEYDPLKDLAPVSMIGKLFTVWIVAPNSRFKSLADLIAEAKAKPGSISFGYIGGGNKLTLARFEAATGARLNQVPFAAGSAAVTALLGGHVDVTNDAVGPGAPLIREGKTRPLAVTSLKPAPQLPGVPTLGETVAGLEQASWYGFLAPTGTPSDRIARLNREFNNALRNQKVRDTLAINAIEIVEMTPEEFGTLIRREIELNAPLIKQFNITN
jgi:tripartite-type tricarboxylate transporter receptor subunit TctC